MHWDIIFFNYNFLLCTYVYVRRIIEYIIIMIHVDEISFFKLIKREKKKLWSYLSFLFFHRKSSRLIHLRLFLFFFIESIIKNFIILLHYDEIVGKFRLYY
jgi:hypothetical protein